MLVKEILEMSTEMKLTDIAKELSIGEKKLRAALKEVGCEPLGVGKRGWEFKGENSEMLERSIFDFAAATNNDNNKKSKPNSIKNNKGDNADASMNNNASKNNSRGENTMVADIQALIKGTNKNENARVYKGIYFDKDIAHFLDNVQHGNKSEIVNKILRQYLVDNELM